MHSQIFTFSNLHIHIHLSTHLNIWICIHKTQYREQSTEKTQIQYGNYYFLSVCSFSPLKIMKKIDVTYVRLDTAGRLHIGLATGLYSQPVVWYIPAALLILVKIIVYPINTFCSQSSDVWAPIGWRTTHAGG